MFSFQPNKLGQIYVKWYIKTHIIWDMSRLVRLEGKHTNSSGQAPKQVRMNLGQNICISLFVQLLHPWQKSYRGIFGVDLAHRGGGNAAHLKYQARQVSLHLTTSASDLKSGTHNVLIGQSLVALQKTFLDLGQKKKYQQINPPHDRGSWWRALKVTLP